MRRPIVAIDGPAGAGKSTVTRRVADQLHYLLVDTGALYRAVALAVQRHGVPIIDEARVGALAQQLVEARELDLVQSTGNALVLLQGEDVSQLIRTPEVSLIASQVSAFPAVRAALLELQRSMGRAGGVVMEGRDIGTVVFPEAEAKFFLTASVDVRAQRRYEELRARGGTPDLETLRREIVERDARDSTRPIAPLRRAADAVVVDSSQLSVAEVAEQIVRAVRVIEAQMRS